MFRPLVLKLKVNEDNWNDEQRVRVNIIRVEPTDMVKESRVGGVYLSGVGWGGVVTKC